MLERAKRLNDIQRAYPCFNDLNEHSVLTNLTMFNERLCRVIPMPKAIEIIKKGESETVEFKATFGKDVIETAVAFANTRGGTILIGVDDGGKVFGQSFRKEALRDYVNRIAVTTEPSVIPDAETVLTPDGAVIVLSVQEFPLKPVATRGRCYRRSGSNTRQMTPSEIAEMHLHSTGQSMDAVIVPGKTAADIDSDAVRRYMRRATEQGRRSFSEKDYPSGHSAFWKESAVSADAGGGSCRPSA